MELTTVWFALIAVLWIGYFTLEGFDFGVGMLLPVLAQDDTERRVLINTIGPVWDGNEVWLLVAGGATFAAFPEWYATLFSGFYLPLLLILVALIVRGLAFEYRAKRDDDQWRRRWDARDRRRLVRARAAVGRGLRQHPARACRSTRTRSTSAASSTCSTPTRLLGGADHAAAVPHPRRDVHRAQDRRPDPAPGPGAGGAGSGSAAAVVAVAFLVWTQADDRQRRPPRCCSCSRRVALVGRAARGPRGPGGLGVRRHVRRASRSAVAGLFVGAVPRRDADLDWPTAFSLTTTNAVGDARTR